MFTGNELVFTGSSVRSRAMGGGNKARTELTRSYKHTHVYTHRRVNTYTRARTHRHMFTHVHMNNEFIADWRSYPQYVLDERNSVTRFTFYFALF